jgi:PDZ domain-containing protein
VLFLVLGVLVLTMHVPYVALTPGPTLNTLGTDSSGGQIIAINGAAAHPTTGHLNLTTVDVTEQSLTIIQTLRGWLEHDVVVVPRSSIIAPGKTSQQVDQEGHQQFVGSQDSAEAAAFCELNYPRAFGVLDVTPKGPSDGILKPGDAFVTLNGQSVDSADKLTGVLSTETPGSVATIVVKRAEVPTTVHVTLGKPLSGRKGASLGIVITEGCLAPYTVDLGLANQIGGPSAGLMFALGIMAKGGGVDLTGGKFIAGTGTIDPQGNVGPIGGIQLKMIAARDAGATVFLAPAANCPDVVKDTPKGLQIVKVSTLHQAVTYLKAIQAGQSVPHC